jgi:hypothetical protein
MAQSGYYTRLSSAMGPPRRRYRGEMLVSAAAAGNLKARVRTESVRRTARGEALPAVGQTGGREARALGFVAHIDTALRRPRLSGSSQPGCR